MAEAYLYPAQPPDCQIPPTQGIPCNGCPWLPQCNYLQLGAQAIRSEQAQNQLLEDNSRLARQVNFLSWDRLMDGYLTLGGFELSLLEEGEFHDALVRDIENGEIGLMNLDVRGVNMVNEYGHGVGNVFLQIVGYIVQKSVRGPHSNSYTGLERRRDGSPVADLLFVRQGGDEVSLLMRGIKKRHFNKRLGQLRERMSVRTALSETSHGVPLIASVGGAHITEVELPTSWGAPESVLSAVDILRNRSDSEALLRRDAQYDILLDHVYAREPQLRERYPNPLDRPPNPIIARKFFQYYFPHFASNVEDVLHGTQLEIERQLRVPRGRSHRPRRVHHRTEPPIDQA